MLPPSSLPIARRFPNRPESQGLASRVAGRPPLTGLGWSAKQTRLTAAEGASRSVSRSSKYMSQFKSAAKFVGSHKLGTGAVVAGAIAANGLRNNTGRPADKMGRGRPTGPYQY